MAQKIFQGYSPETGFVLVNVRTTKSGTEFLTRRVKTGDVLEVFQTQLKGPTARLAYRRQAIHTLDFLRSVLKVVMNMSDAQGVFVKLTPCLLQTRSPMSSCQ